ncbi:MAG: formylmethanofuran dehydrogenase subunit C [Pirellulales bacterium]
MTWVARNLTGLPIEVAGLTPTALADKSLAEIERLPVQQGNRQVPVAEFFDISGAASERVWQFEGDLSRVHWLAAGLDAGRIHVDGSVGRHAGSGMSGGTLTISGDAGDWLGAEMSGGHIDVAGSAGNLVAAPYRGARRGMTGGTILIRGDAGDELGRAMRRGLIAVAGNVGTAAGYDLLAGTILIGGSVGPRLGAGTRRGTIVLTRKGALSRAAPLELPPTFRRAARYQPTFLRLLARHLAQFGFPFSLDDAAAEYETYVGDLLTVGKGEVLVRVDR